VRDIGKSTGVSPAVVPLACNPEPLATSKLTGLPPKPAILLPAIDLFASSGPDFQEGPSDLPVRRTELALRQLNAEADE
jgi:hypothetical protein